MGYLKSIGTVIIYIGLFLTVITFLPGLPPETDFSEYSIKLPTEPQDRFELKNRLQGAEVLFSGAIKGPESFASYNGELYTGIRGGYVVKIEDNHIVPIVKFGKKCDGLWQEEKCGRPLGLQFNKKGDLFVADTYYGIFKVDVNTRQYINIVNISVPINGKIPKLINSLDVAKNGDIYWTDSSTDFVLHDGVNAAFANPSGRLIRYNVVTKKNEVLLQNLVFANGVLLSDDESFVIVLETFASRIIKYHLKGPKIGQQEIFVEALPGLPDNVHSDGQGGFLVTLIQYVDPQYPFIAQSLMPHPYIRKMLVRLLYLIEAPFKLLQDVYPNYYAERVLHSIGSFETSKILDTKGISVVLRLDKAGNILDALYSEDGSVHNVCSAYIHNGYLWLGSPWNEYIMKVPLKQALPDLKENVRKQAENEPLPTVPKKNVKLETKPTNAKPIVRETTPKSTTTSPEPTVKVPTTQKPVADAKTQKPIVDSTTQKPVTVTTTTKPIADAKTQKPVVTDSVTQKPITDEKVLKSTTHSHPTTTTPKPSSSPPTEKTLTKDTTKNTAKDIKKDSINEIKKDNVNAKTSNVKTESSEKGNKATVRPKSDGSVKDNTRDTRSEKSKPVEKK
ncbi:adipocyte plasma membrane-associated protein-like [Colletes gigas]|uniref:adipocyte plasma membrane-associated protein-like n=1 Tax=Colletes gigas TaxID=935657 RepID=UPI001C9B5B5E|nr:adipocyte plasma membrane-associated protein-like [Colletes gigas]